MRYLYCLFVPGKDAVVTSSVEQKICRGFTDGSDRLGAPSWIRNVSLYVFGVLSDVEVYK